ncbi:unnamed protein product [Clonostachys byssicola]|uniref:Nucleoside phosphorylase domain-containing protein n=1 Tax=Clonostachys byssicola TaxID=160290 RepID=A0A9N9XVV8_9HYPO|nr:unnamed protein product [Clonostachys byssicola]
MMKKTWFLPPDFTFLPDGEVRLGMILKYPDRPTLALDSLESLVPSDPGQTPTIYLPEVSSLTETDHEHSMSSGHSANFILFANTRILRLEPLTMRSAPTTSSQPTNTAATAMFDTLHDVPLHVSNHDNISYKFGSIGVHNVVMTVLPDGVFGLSSAASIYVSMRQTFPSINYISMVGTGGGVPPTIRLGDVVVGTPTAHYAAVVQVEQVSRIDIGR